VSKKTEKPIKPRKPEKKITEKTEPKKNPIKPIKILKKPAGSVRFRFYKHKTEKTNRTETGKKPEKKPSQTEPKPEKLSQTGLNRFFP